MKRTRFILASAIVLALTASPVGVQHNLLAAWRHHYEMTVYDLYQINGLAWTYGFNPCGYTTAGGCFDGHQVIIVAGGIFDPRFTQYTLWHEFHHWLDQAEGIAYTGIANECAADAYAFARDRSAIGKSYGYGCVNGKSSKYPVR